MIIDIHTHTFPDKIAEKAIPRLAFFADTVNYLDGTEADLVRSMERNSVDLSVLLPVATSPRQTEKLNQIAIEKNNFSKESGTPSLLSFGAIHPDNEDYKEIINLLSLEGVPGIKIHPVYQECDFDDPRYMRIVSYATERDMAVMVHGGYDVGYPGSERVTVSRILPVLDEVKPTKLILAHMGSWDEWDTAEEALCGRDVYFDTAFTLTPLVPVREKLAAQGLAQKVLSPEEFEELSNTPHNWYSMSEKQFVRFVEKHGAGKILFGSDSPWDDQGLAIQRIRNLFDPKTADLILGKNAEELLF